MFFAKKIMAMSAKAITGWIQVGNDMNGESAADRSGQAVSLNSDGTILAVGAPYNDASGPDSGHVRIYAWNGSSWMRRGQDIDGTSAGERSGHSVSINGDGTVLAVGSPYAGTAYSGKVRVYAWNGSSWARRGQDIDGTTAGDQNGFSVGINGEGTVVAIGSPGSDANGTDSGLTTVHAWNGSSWSMRGQGIVGESAGDQSGHSVSINENGTILAIGAPRNDGNGTNSGHVRVYAWNGSAWVRRGQDIDGEAPGDQSGFSVCINKDGNLLLIGAPYNSGKGTESGHARAYAWSGSSWVRRGQDIDGDAPSDRSGWSVAVNGDGTVLSVGSELNGGNGPRSGQVRSFIWNGSSWTKIGPDLYGKAEGDLGGRVSLDSSGLTIAIGSYGNDAGGQGSGQVRVFKYQDQIRIQSHPSDQTSYDGTAVFSVASTTENGTAPSYRWQVSVDGSVWNDLAGQNGSSLTLSGIDESYEGNSYKVVLSAFGAPTVASNPATLTVSGLTILRTISGIDLHTIDDKKIESII